MDFNMTISESTKEESKSETYELSYTWEITYVQLQGVASVPNKFCRVKPHETVSLIQKMTVTTGTQVYYQVGDTLYVHHTPELT
jgi:hypothetical protein